MRNTPEIHLMEGIGMARDLRARRVFIADLAGTLYRANLDGSNPKVLLFAEGNLNGVAYAKLPAGL